MPLADIGLRYLLGIPERREEQRRWEALYGEGGLERKKLGIQERRITLDEDTLNQRTKEFGETVKRWDADRGIRRTEDETRRIQSGISLVMRTMQESPENVQRISDAVLKPYGYDLTFEPTEDPAEWKGGVTDSGLFWRMNLKKPLDKGGLEVSDQRDQGRLGEIKPKDQFSMLKSSLKVIESRWGTGKGGIGALEEDASFGDILASMGTSDSYVNLKKAAERGDPEARQDYADYQKMWNRMKEIAGMQGITEGQKYSIDTEEGYRAGARNRLMNIGRPMEPQKRVIRTGIDPDTGRRVVMYEDGTIDYAD
jgi:hypothetical protein